VSVESEKAARRKRKAPRRRLASVVEERERKPMFFGWGGELTHREKESVKERIALYAGIGLAVLLLVILGWGWYQDAVVTPAARAAEANKEIAVVGNNTIRMGYFKRYEKFRSDEINSQLTQVQSQLQSLQADPTLAKKNATQIAQFQAEASQFQQQLGSLNTNSVSDLIENQVLFQRASTLGVSVSAKTVNSNLLNFERTQTGGRGGFVTFLAQSGLTPDEFKSILQADLLRAKVVKVLSAKVSHVQTKVRASHILIPTKQKALAQRLFHQVQGGASIAPLAKKYSKDPGSAAKGGDLGYFGSGVMVAPFDKAAFSMKVGDVRLVQSSYGWHIIKKTGTERVRLTSSEYTQAQQQAYVNWLSSQQARMHVQRLIAATNLPLPASSVATVSPLSPAQVPQVASTQVPQVLPTSTKKP
jgi:parvulin-like peptidyl-prolyl isomerase